MPRGRAKVSERAYINCAQMRNSTCTSSHAKSVGFERQTNHRELLGAQKCCTTRTGLVAHRKSDIR